MKKSKRYEEQIKADREDKAASDATIARLRERELEEFVAGIAKRHGATLAEACGRMRTAHRVVARHAAWLALRQQEHDGRFYSYPAIAWLWGVDPSTVITAVHNAKAAVEEKARRVA